MKLIFRAELSPDLQGLRLFEQGVAEGNVADAEAPMPE
jgi:hypothetical protein